jgi:hypothetical protein
MMLATPHPRTTFTWTIATRISDALAEAERLYGPRDQRYFFAGHEFHDGHPRVWFPRPGHVVMQLNAAHRDDFPRLVFELAHEVIHLLAPSARANNLEEGLAVAFSEAYTLRETGRVVPFDIPSYAAARDAVKRLLALDGDCIKRVRATTPRFSRITSRQLLEAAPGLSIDDARFLSSAFVR